MKHFQGIHDRLLHDQEFRIRMVENHRDEELCRRWDALADEDHTHRLTVQEYFYHKNKWWLHSISKVLILGHWYWQGSRWTSHPSESQEGDEPSIE